jgi:hypothetical protein
MSALDDAITAHMAHPAGGGTDCLTDSLCDEQITQPAPLHIREGWEHEPIDPGHPWLLYLVAFLFGLLGFGALGGCAQTGPRTAAPAAEPCPPMPLHRVDPKAARTWQDIIDARNAELADATRKACWPQRSQP